jgi:hypothetical protein
VKFPGVRFSEFIANRYVQLLGADGQLAPMRLYRRQATFARAVWDSIDPSTRVRRYRRAIFSTPKKFGKSTFAAVQALYHLVFDPFETDREVYSIAGDLDQAKIVLEQARKIVQRSPRLRALFQKDYRSELVLEDRDTGQVHRFRALASDSPTSHGLNPSLVIVDEGWQFRDYELLEAVSLGPQRRCPLQLWVTYAGLKAQMVAGVPLYDLYRAGLDGSDSKLFFSWMSGLDAYGELPTGFIRDGYLEEQRTLLPANRFARLHLNEWGQRDVGFLTDAEVAAAVDASLGVLTQSAASHVLAVDYGRTKDHTALVTVGRDVHRRFRVAEATKFAGSPENPVPLELVEDAIADRAARFALERILIDPYQMLGTAERLSRRLRLPIFDTAKAEQLPRARAIVLRPIGPAYLNRLTMGLLATFRSRGIVIPGALTDLVDQLGAVISKETFYGVRIDAGTGAGVRGRDDLVVALGMAVTELEARGSLAEIPAYVCRISNGTWRQCALVDVRRGSEQWRYHDRCRSCDGLAFVRGAHDQAVGRALGQGLEAPAFRTFLQEQVRPYLHPTIGQLMQAEFEALL